MFRSLCLSLADVMLLASKMLLLSLVWFSVAESFQSPQNILAPPHHRSQTSPSRLPTNPLLHKTTTLHASPTLQELERLELIPCASTTPQSTAAAVVDNDTSFLSPPLYPIAWANDTATGFAVTEITPSVVSPSPSSLVIPGQLLVILAAAMYGTNFPLVKLLDQLVPSALSAALRFSLAAVMVGGAVMLSEKQNYSNKSDRLPSMLRGMEVGAWYGIGYISQALALHTVEAGKCAFFGALAVVIVPLLDALFKKVSPSLQSMGAVILAISGVAILELGGLSATTASTLSSGDVMSAIMACSFAVGYWRLGTAAEDYPQQAARITLGQLIAVALGSTLYAFLSLPSELFSWHGPIAHWISDPFVLGALAWTGLASTALAMYMETIALRTMSASELTVLMTSTSLWAAAFGYVTLGEVMSPTSLAGGVLILAACLVSAQEDNTNKEQEGDDSLRVER